MPGGIEEQFYFNSMIANNLALMYSANDRKLIRAWLEKLHCTTREDIKEDYMWFLLKLLHGRRLMCPFDKMPSDCDLLPFKEAVNPCVFNEVLKNFEDAGLCWLDEMIIDEAPCTYTKDGNQQTDHYSSIPPPLFLDNQPKPKKGVICYMAAFSDQEPAATAPSNFFCNSNPPGQKCALKKTSSCCSTRSMSAHSCASRNSNLNEENIKCIH